MLPKEDNELITRSNAGTPMGNLMRRYWVPALLSEEIPKTDCPPVRVKLLGEELVAFRDTKGRIGLVGEQAGLSRAVPKPDAGTICDHKSACAIEGRTSHLEALFINPVPFRGPVVAVELLPGDVGPVELLTFHVPDRAFAAKVPVIAVPALLEAAGGLELALFDPFDDVERPLFDLVQLALA